MEREHERERPTEWSGKQRKNLHSLSEMSHYGVLLVCRNEKLLQGQLKLMEEVFFLISLLLGARCSLFNNWKIKCCCFMAVRMSIAWWKIITALVNNAAALALNCVSSHKTHSLKLTVRMKMSSDYANISQMPQRCDGGGGGVRRGEWEDKWALAWQSWFFFIFSFFFTLLPSLPSSESIYKGTWTWGWRRRTKNVNFFLCMVIEFIFLCLWWLPFRATWNENFFSNKIVPF